MGGVRAVGAVVGAVGAVEAVRATKNSESKHLQQVVYQVAILSRSYKNIQ